MGVGGDVGIKDEPRFVVIRTKFGMNSVHGDVGFE